MQVTLKNLLPNPFRNLPHYPIDREKIRKLKSSIQRTGFWDNMVARRRSDGKFEIGYGHHRRVALLEMYPGTHKVGVIPRKLDDGTMIKVMADENDEIYNLSPAVINETVKAARDYLRAHPKEAARTGGRVQHGTGSKIEAPRIANFLDWDRHRVEEALAELSDIKAGAVEKEALEQIPSQKAAQSFRQQVKKHKATPKVQRQVAARLHRQEIGTKDIAPAIIDASLPKKQKKLAEFEDFLEDGARKINTAATFLFRLTDYKEDFDGGIYRGTIQRYEVESSCQRFLQAFNKIFSRRTNHGKGHRKSLPVPRK